MLNISALAKHYGERVLFQGVDLVMSPGERLGLIGRNGTGKTTLFRLILGEEHPDSGAIEIPRLYRVGHLSQLIHFDRPTVLEEAASGLPEREGGWVETHRAEKMLMGLGFALEDFARAPAQLSGGYQVRLQLARLLLSEPNLLLLDEPTNYLDILSVRWLERFLRAWPNELILITHDQDFMNAVTTHTMLIHRGSTRRIRGTTTQLYDMIAQEEEIHEKTRLNEEKARRQQERFIERFRYKASKARSVQSRIKLLEKRAVLDELSAIAELEFSFRAAPFTGESMLSAEQLSFRYSPESPLLFSGVDLTVRKGERVAIVGKNGKGKTTLLNILAGEFEPARGSVRHHPNLRLAHFGQNQIEALDPAKTVEQTILESHADIDRRSARAICGAMMFEGDDALKRVRMLSGGERARVLLGKLLVAPANMLLLDEPTNHLDMDAIDSLIEAIGAFDGGVLLVTHNERVLHALATRLVVFDRGRVSVFEGIYEDFLERIGWGDEERERERKSGEAARTAPVNRKEERRQRAEQVARRSKILKPLETEVKRLEERIIADEERERVLNAEMCTASERGEASAIARLAQELGATRARIEKGFAELERTSTELAAKRAEFERDGSTAD